MNAFITPIINIVINVRNRVCSTANEYSNGFRAGFFGVAAFKYSESVSRGLMFVIHNISYTNNTNNIYI